MKKLEEYREQQAGNFEDYSSTDINTARWNGRKEGFDIAIALELPVKFAMYIGDKYLNTDEVLIREHYKYWIDNIFKFE